MHCVTGTVLSVIVDQFCAGAALAVMAVAVQAATAAQRTQLQSEADTKVKRPLV